MHEIPFVCQGADDEVKGMKEEAGGFSGEDLMKPEICLRGDCVCNVGWQSRAEWWWMNGFLLSDCKLAHFFQHTHAHTQTYEGEKPGNYCVFWENPISTYLSFSSPSFSSSTTSTLIKNFITIMPNLAEPLSMIISPYLAPICCAIGRKPCGHSWVPFSQPCLLHTIDSIHSDNDLR